MAINFEEVLQKISIIVNAVTEVATHECDRNNYSEQPDLDIFITLSGRSAFHPCSLLSRG